MADFCGAGDTAWNLDWVLKMRECRHSIDGQEMVDAVELTLVVPSKSGEPRLLTEVLTGAGRREFLETMRKAWGWPAEQRQGRRPPRQEWRED